MEDSNFLGRISLLSYFYAYRTRELNYWQSGSLLLLLYSPMR